MSSTPEFYRENFPDDSKITSEDIAGVPQVEKADQIIRRTAKRIIKQQAAAPRAILTTEEEQALAHPELLDIAHLAEGALKIAQERIDDLRRTIKNQPQDNSLVARLELINQHRDKIEQLYQDHLQHGGTMTSADIEQDERFIASNLEAIQNEWPLPERWPGQMVHEIPDEDAGAGAYEAAVVEHWTDTTEAPEIKDSITAEEHMDAIGVAYNKIRANWSDTTRITESMQTILTEAVTLRALAHNEFVRLQRIRQDPLYTPDQKSLHTLKPHRIIRQSREALEKIAARVEVV